MDTRTIQALCKLNGEFYRTHHASFAETRQSAWPGWKRVASLVPKRPQTVLDVACGTLRFKAFCEHGGIETVRPYHAIDSCEALLPDDEGVSFQELDIAGALLEDRLAAAIKAPACSLVACFGFAHHVPTGELRARLVDSLLEKASPGGLVALSFWQFARDPKMLDKAKRTTERGISELGVSLGENDFLLGWNGVDGAYRYCHSFSDGELDELAAHVEGRAALVGQFRADGRTAEMNGYRVFHKC